MAPDRQSDRQDLSDDRKIAMTSDVVVAVCVLFFFSCVAVALLAFMSDWSTTKIANEQPTSSATNGSPNK